MVCFDGKTNFDICTKIRTLYYRPGLSRGLRLASPVVYADVYTKIQRDVACNRLNFVQRTMELVCAE